MEQILRPTPELAARRPHPPYRASTVVDALSAAATTVRCDRPVEILTLAKTLTAQELVDRSLERMRGQSTNTAIFDQDLILRTKLMDWLLGTGVDPDQLKAREGFPAQQMALANPTGLEQVSDTTAPIFSELLIFAMEGFIIFSEVHATVEDGDLLRAIAFLNELRNHLPAIERGIGWDEARSEQRS